MIEKPTTFIIGAGASVPYGFPSGHHLVEMLCDPNMDQALETIGQDVQTYHKFATALKMSQLTSIDTFLEQQGKERQEFGKLAIASKLLPCERSAPLTCVTQIIPRKHHKDGGGHWLRHLWASLKTRKLEEMANNKVNFVVFNYDRVLEQFLWMVIRGTYPDRTDTECAAAMHSIAIVHPYGSLGRFDFGDADKGHSKGEGEPVAFGDCTPEALRNAAKGIRIIPEQRESGDLFDRATELMDESDRLVFLGFGYENTNMERLRVLDWCKRKLKRRSVTSHYAHAVGSAYGLAPAEAYKVRSMCFLGSPSCLGSPTDDSLSFLRSRVDLEAGKYDGIVATRYAHDLPRLLGANAP